ncbi:4692_t:CDS:2 [Acaulospora morrowiae]|uniref:4692_t:CDS:1 n=1 Tax=Acaulospora morrowiae TaxID=94023 RepID=A0A9N8WB39_9GLOM|nr:4692_t:CDS:2 [Acaulospora morrowiae]
MPKSSGSSKFIKPPMPSIYFTSTDSSSFTSPPTTSTLARNVPENYIRLISCDGYEFVVDKDVALLSGTIKNLFSSPWKRYKTKSNLPRSIPSQRRRLGNGDQISLPQAKAHKLPIGSANISDESRLRITTVSRRRFFGLLSELLFKV